MVDARVVRGGNPCVEVRFSEPLAASAAKEGLIELSGVLRQTIDIKDNCARVYFEGESDGNLAVAVHQGLKSAGGLALAEDFRTAFPSVDPLPAVEIPLEGNILPDESGLILPFRAVNLSAVDLRNVLRFCDRTV